MLKTITLFSLLFFFYALIHSGEGSIIQLLGPTNRSDNNFIGDLNPYGLAIAKQNNGLLQVGDILVSNFNNKDNQQGTGRTIIRFRPSALAYPNEGIFLFAKIPDAVNDVCDGNIGLTTALVILNGGYVVVGSLPTTDGSIATAKQGCLIILNSEGQVVSTIQHDLIRGPWDMTFFQDANHVKLFVSMVLNGDVRQGNAHVVNKGSIVRIDLDFDPVAMVMNNGKPVVTTIKTIASGFSEKADPDALIIGPTGLALGYGDLYVADSLNNRIAVIRDVLLPDSANSPLLEVDYVSTDMNLNDPLGLDFSDNNSPFFLLAANGQDSNVVKIDLRTGAQTTYDTSAGAGGLFGIAIVNANEFYFVDDNTNTLKLFQLV